MGGGGKSTRQIAKALGRAKAGTLVFYVTRGPPWHYVRLARQVAPEARFTASRNLLWFDDTAGAVFFREDSYASRDDFAGLKGVVAVDHAADLPRHLLGWLRSAWHHWEIDTEVPASSQEDQQSREGK